VTSGRAEVATSTLTEDTEDTTTTAVVDVPSGLEGFVLVLRLHDHRAHNKQTSDGHWRVHVPLADVEAVPDFLSAVEQWLRSEGILGTTVHIGGDVHQVMAATGSRRLPLLRQLSQQLPS
jgi:hypothetical protein